MEAQGIYKRQRKAGEGCWGGQGRGVEGGPGDRGVLEGDREELFRDERIIVTINVVKSSNVGQWNQHDPWSEKPGFPLASAYNL